MIALNLQSWLLLFRRRLLWAFTAAMFFTLLTFMWVAAESPTDFGVFWHHFCGCPVDRDDLRVLLNFPITFGFIGFLLGLSTPQVTSMQAGAAASYADTRFLLTRPIHRDTSLFAPLAVATVAIAFIPPLAMALLLGWLQLVHAPALAYLLATVQQIPAVAALGPHPTFAATLEALHMARRYTASVTLGLCGYAIMASQRWLILSPSRTLKLFGVLPAFLLFIPIARIFGGTFINYLLMAPGRDATLGTVPSTAAILIHFIFATSLICGSWRLLSTTEL